MQYSLTTLIKHLSLIWIALIILISGFMVSALVERLNIEFIKRFPKWFMGYIMGFTNPNKPFWQIMLFIFLFNSISIFIYMLSAVTIILPIFIIFLTGLNIGVVIQEQSKINEPQKPTNHHPIYALVAMLVLFIETFVFCFALAMGISMVVALSINFSLNKIFVLATPRIIAYINICMPLLLISAYLETKALKEISK